MGISRVLGAHCVEKSSILEIYRVKKPAVHISIKLILSLMNEIGTVT